MTPLKTLISRSMEKLNMTDSKMDFKGECVCVCVYMCVNAVNNECLYTTHTHIQWNLGEVAETEMIIQWETGGKE